MPILEQFIHHLTFEKRLSEKTIVAYKSDLQQFTQFLSSDGSGSDLLLVKPGQVRGWVLFLMDAGIGARSVHRKISSLRHFYRFCMRERLLESNPASAIVLPKTEKRLPVYVEEDALESLFNDFDFENGFEGVRDRLILELLYGTGMRLSELINLRVQDVDIHTYILRVRGKGSKDRIIPFPRPIANLYKEYAGNRDSVAGEKSGEYLFLTKSGKKLYPKFVYRLVKKYLSYVTAVRKKSPHVLRHSYATHLLNRGADLNAIKELLGHSSLAATQVYTHTNLTKLKSIHKKAHPRAND